ncbi:MAG: hypothetical protein L0Y60_10930 [Beijerinckiaceae bacterium]|nr:hypothetical protein [Beijerinckiaceae bacterium]
MRPTEQRQDQRMLKLRDGLSRWEVAEVSQLEAAGLLGMSERPLRRWVRRFEEWPRRSAAPRTGAKGRADRSSA